MISSAVGTQGSCDTTTSERHVITNAMLDGVMTDPHCFLLLTEKCVDSLCIKCKCSLANKNIVYFVHKSNVESRMQLIYNVQNILAA